jgi:hypothetical protein
MCDTPPKKHYPRFRIRIGLGVTILGFIIFLIGANPGLFRLDRSSVIGFVQISIFLIGLALICLGGYLSLASLWNGYLKTIASDIGFRLVSTGYVVAVASGMADVFGFGTQKPPAIPYFGELQAAGVILGEAIIGLGFILLIPYKHPHPKEDVHTASNVKPSG